MDNKIIKEINNFYTREMENDILKKPTQIDIKFS